MSEPIDLDLVELRCRLRGWHCDRRGSSLDAYTDHGNISMAASGDWSCVGEALGAQRLLTARRWTLDRLSDAPPEGWRSEGSHTVKLVRSGAEVVFDPLLGVQEWIDPRRPYAERAAAHAAVAELFLILAEVEI